MRDYRHSVRSDLISYLERNSHHIFDFFLNFLAATLTIIELALRGCVLLLRNIATLAFRLIIVALFAVIIIAAYLVVSALYLSAEPFFGSNIS